MLSIVLLTLLIVAFAIPPCLNTTFKVFERFGALKGKSYLEILGLQILKTLREEKNIVREFRRCNKGGYMFRCTLAEIESTMFTPGLAIFYILT